MKFWIHLILAVILTIYFIYRFIKDRHVYEMLFIIWIPSTLLTYFTEDRTFLLGLGIFQTIMFILVIYFMFRRRGDRRIKTLQMLSEMAADRLPKEDASNEQATKTKE